MSFGSKTRVKKHPRFNFNQTNNYQKLFNLKKKHILKKHLFLTIHPSFNTADGET